MKFVRILYLLSFLAPVAFLMGYIVGAPRQAPVAMHLPDIDARPMPVSERDVHRFEGSMMSDGNSMLKPNRDFTRP